MKGIGIQKSQQVTIFNLEPIYLPIYYDGDFLSFFLMAFWWTAGEVDFTDNGKVFK